MQQLSLPFRLALAAMLVFGVLWTLVLKPKDKPTPAPVAPGVAGLTGSANGARSAVDKANSAASSREQAADAVDPSTASSAPAPAATAAKPGTAAATATKPASKTAKPAAPVKAAKPAPPGSLESFVAGAGPAKSLVQWLADGKVVVMVFKNSSSDSAAVERAARQVSATSKHRIRLRVTNIGNVGKYAVFTEKTPIAQAPTTLIIGPKKTARVIVGFTTAGEIRDAVSGVRRQAAAAN